jgi:hypothetical protein
MFKNSAEYGREISLAKFTSIYRQDFPVSLLGVSVDIWQGALMYELGIIGTRMGRTLDQKNGRNAWNALYDTTL